MTVELKDKKMESFSSDQNDALHMHLDPAEPSDPLLPPTSDYLLILRLSVKILQFFLNFRNYFQHILSSYSN